MAADWKTAPKHQPPNTWEPSLMHTRSTQDTWPGGPQGLRTLQRWRIPDPVAPIYVTRYQTRLKTNKQAERDEKGGDNPRTIRFIPHKNHSIIMSKAYMGEYKGWKCHNPLLLKRGIRWGPYWNALSCEPIITCVTLDTLRQSLHTCDTKLVAGVSSGRLQKGHQHLKTHSHGSRLLTC